MDHIFSNRLIQENHHEYNLDLSMIFIDFKQQRIVSKWKHDSPNKENECTEKVSKNDALRTQEFKYKKIKYNERDPN